jgi:hypothetical protein
LRMTDVISCTMLGCTVSRQDRNLRPSGRDTKAGQMAACIAADRGRVWVVGASEVLGFRGPQAHQGLDSWHRLLHQDGARGVGGNGWGLHVCTFACCAKPTGEDAFTALTPDRAGTSPIASSHAAYRIYKAGASADAAGTQAAIAAAAQLATGTQLQLPAGAAREMHQAHLQRKQPPGWRTCSSMRFISFMDVSSKSNSSSAPLMAWQALTWLALPVLMARSCSGHTKTMGSVRVLRSGNINMM